MTCQFRSNEELASHALQVLTAYQQRFGPVREPPVPVQQIAEDLFDLLIDWTDEAPFDRLTEGERVPAALSVSPTQRKLLMNERERPFFDRYFGTIEYSMAHEVGHALLHLSGSLDQQSRLFFPNDSVLLCRVKNGDRQEIQAERFASYLLMPEHLIQSAVGDQTIDSRRQIDELRFRFRVSWTAMTLRLQELDLAHVDSSGTVHPSRAAAVGQIRLPL